MNYVVAVDVGGAEIKSTRVDSAFNVVPETVDAVKAIFPEFAHYKLQAGTIGCAMLAFDLVKGGK